MHVAVDIPAAFQSVHFGDVFEPHRDEAAARGRVFEAMKKAVLAAGSGDTVVAPYLTLAATDSRHYRELASEIVRSTPSSDVLEQPMLTVGVAPPIAASVGASAPFVLSAGEDITAMAIDGNRLVLRVKGDSGGAIVIYDLAQGAEVQRIRVLENPASGDNGL